MATLNETVSYKSNESGNLTVDYLSLPRLYHIRPIPACISSIFGLY